MVRPATIVSRTRLLLMVCCGSPALVQMVVKTLRRNAVTSRPAISHPSLASAVLPDSPVPSGIVIGQKAYHIHRLRRFLFVLCNLWIALLVAQRLQRIDAHRATGGK